MGDRCGMSISADSPSDETLNRGPLALLLWRQYEFPFGINIVQFSIFFFNLEIGSLWCRGSTPPVNSKQWNDLIKDIEIHTKMCGLLCIYMYIISLLFAPSHTPFEAPGKTDNFENDKDSKSKSYSNPIPVFIPSLPEICQVKQCM